MERILVTGSGKIGSLIACLLAQLDDYHVDLADINEANFNAVRHVPNLMTHSFDVTDSQKMTEYVQKHSPSAVVACLPYFCDVKIAESAKSLGLHYFDLTEDVRVGETVKMLAQDSQHAFVSKCGLAPGLVNIVANDLIKQFDSVQSVKLRVGALPENINNPLLYALTWSTEGLINEYGNTCYGLFEKKKTALKPLEGLEKVTIDGVEYEAFNTSGGIGNLVEMYEGKINSLNYKSLRYPGHRDKIDFLMRGLKLNEDRETLKRILENAIPTTTQDVTIIYVSAVGNKNNKLVEKNFVMKVYPKKLFDKKWSAIQLSTAVTASAVIDIVLTNKENYHGYIYQENFNLGDVAGNRIGKILELKVNE